MIERKKTPKIVILGIEILSIKKSFLYLHSLLRRCAQNGPFVYRLVRKIFILKRAVRLCYGLLIINDIKKIKVNYGKP